MQQYSKVATVLVNFTNVATFGVGCLIYGVWRCALQ